MKAILIALVMASCASQPYYEWVQTSTPAKHSTWWYVTKAQAASICRNTSFLACAYKLGESCNVYTYLSEAELPFRTDWDGLPVKDHEEKHCLGFVHKEQT